MPRLIKYQNKYDDLYKAQEAEFEGKNVDFFSCYENNLDYCTNCETTFKSTFLNLLSKIDINPNFNFMDCGSGLGFPMYLASDKFNKVYGIEIISEIAQIARNNLENMQVKNFQIITSDIRNIDEDILNSINVFYLFNPFINSIIDEFIVKVVNSILKCDREVWIIYANAVCVVNFSKYNDILPLKYLIDDFKKVAYFHHECR